MWGGLRNGKLSHAGAYVDGLGTMVPLAPGVFLESVRLGVCLEPPPFQVKGGAAVSFGPSVDGKSAVRIDGDLHYSDAWNGTPWFIKANGSLSLFGKQVATSDFTYWGSGMIDFNFNGKLDFGVASVEGGVAGWIETRSPSRFNVEGWVAVCVHSIGCLEGRAVASSIGAAGCIKVTLHGGPGAGQGQGLADLWTPWRVHWEWQKVSVKGGAGYTWKNNELDLMLIVVLDRQVDPGAAVAGRRRSRRSTCPRTCRPSPRACTVATRRRRSTWSAPTGAGSRCPRTAASSSRART